MTLNGVTGRAARFEMGCLLTSIGNKGIHPMRWAIGCGRAEHVDLFPEIVQLSERRTETQVIYKKLTSLPVEIVKSPQVS